VCVAASLPRVPKQRCLGRPAVAIRRCPRSIRLDDRIVQQYSLAPGLLHFCQFAEMKVTVTLTSRGVVTLPAKLRQALGLQADDQLIAETTAAGLLLRPAVTLPLEVNTPEREREFDEAEAEAELAAVLARKARPRPLRTTKR